MAKQNYIPRPRKCQPCICCGKWHESKKESKYCSSACRARAQPKRMRKRSHNGAKQRGPFTCQNCKTEYYTRRRSGEGETYCGRDCYYAHNKAKPRHSNINIIDCRACGSAFTSRHASAATCSDQCFKQEANSRSREYEVKKHNADKTIHEVECIVCSIGFCRMYGTKTNICSEECRAENKKAAKRAQKRKLGGSSHRKRARHFGVYYEPVNVLKVFDRDGWRCQMCGIATPKHLRGKNKHNSPELDHVVPISKQGPHTYSNTQCSCRQCNGDKGCGTKPSQMPLYAA